MGFEVLHEKSSIMIISLQDGAGEKQLHCSWHTKYLRFH